MIPNPIHCMMYAACSPVDKGLGKENGNGSEHASL